MTSPSSSLPVAVVTGAARGIGLAITNWFLAHGHRVLMVDVDEATLTAAAALTRTSKSMNLASSAASDSRQLQHAL